MKHHVKIYLNAFGYKIQSDCACEICGRPANDVHHINARGMGGNPSANKDKIENLMGLCREHHEEYGDVSDLKIFLTLIHLIFLKHNALQKTLSGLQIPIDEQIKRAYDLRDYYLQTLNKL